MVNPNACPGCSLILPKVGGSIHPYMLSSAACWKLYGEVLAREYSNKDYWQIHRLTVDTYALQHPGNKDRRAIQSVNVHLASLYYVFEKHYSLTQATKALDEFIKRYKTNFIFLERPISFGDLTIMDVWRAENAIHHVSAVEQWARLTWQAWSKYHSYIASFVG